MYFTLRQLGREEPSRPHFWVILTFAIHKGNHDCSRCCSRPPGKSHNAESRYQGVPNSLSRSPILSQRAKMRSKCNRPPCHEVPAFFTSVRMMSGEVKQNP